MLGAYCIAIHVPIYVDGPRTYATSEWRRALYLLRDSFEGQFDRLIVVAPSRPITTPEQATHLEPLGGTQDDGLDVRPSLPLDGGKRDYWLGSGRRQWRADVTAALREAEVGHMGLSDLYRPINYDALLISLRQDVTTVFVRDTDEVTKMRNLIAAGQTRGGPDRAVYLWAYERAMRRAVAGADLSLLKGQALMERYGAQARNARCFHDTSYRTNEIVAADVIDRRVSDLHGDRPVRLVYCGRLVERKGCDHSISIVARARAAGANVTLDLIGDGPARDALHAQCQRDGLGEAVRFLGEKSYGPALIRELGDYDGLLFTPRSEDTPRMIFDGYAAGLPLVGYDIPYVRERAAEEQATVLLPFDDIAASAAALTALDAGRDRLEHLARAAHRAAYDNASDVWYRRRADWTLEAHAARKNGLRV